MRYRQLVKSGLRVSQLILGTSNVGDHEQFAPLGALDKNTVDRLVKVALDAGVNMIDTADLYSHGQAEEIIGASLKGRRDDVLIATKARFPVGDGPNEAGSSRYHLTRAVEASLRHLGTDHIDLLYLHQWDGETPIEETLQTLDQLIRDGKVRYTGFRTSPHGRSPRRSPSPASTISSRRSPSRSTTRLSRARRSTRSSRRPSTAASGRSSGARSARAC